jgi:hypothetical protein
MAICKESRTIALLASVVVSGGGVQVQPVELRLYITLTSGRIFGMHHHYPNGNGCVRVVHY